MSVDRRLAIQRYAHERLHRETRAYGAQATLARQLCLSTAHISNILNHPSTHKIGDDMIHKLAEHWGLDYAELQCEALAAVGLLAPSKPRIVEFDDGYPSRAAARAVARSGCLPVSAQGGKPTMTSEQANRVRAAMRHRIAHEHGGRAKALATELRVRGPSISQILSGKNRPGYGTALALASVLHITVDELLNGVAPSPPTRTVELDDRYPSRAAARAVARSGGLPDAAIAEVDANALGANDDPGVFFWIDQYRAVAARLALSTPARVDTAASTARTKPRLPRR